MGELIGIDQRVAASSGTAAFHLLLEALDVSPGQEVILPSYTCQSLLHPIHHVGADPVLADVEEGTYSLSERTVKPHLSDRTALIVLVHNFGHPVNEPDLFDLDLPVAEDLAHALGARLDDNEHVGSRGLAAFGSLYATKQLAAGLGGFVASNSNELIKDVRDLKTYDERNDFRPAYNYSFSDLNAGLARSQLQKLDDHREKREQLADLYDSELDDLEPIQTLNRPSGHAFYRYLIRCPRAHEVGEHIRSHEQIEVKSPVHRPLHQIVDDQNCPTTDQLHSETLMLPLHPSLTKQNAREVITALKNSLRVLS